MQTIYNDHPATHDTIEKIEQWVKAANEYHATYSEAVIICNDGKGLYALEDLK
ncbi:hypothetical protein [Escherichia phage fp01]|uniref:Uncharacterized protein n=1 Tax=Escherichia phage fp01 TaxID=2315695 RepID=A0A6C1FJ38_9CAUD|nr:hypothetical protein HWB87_gp119 [Escherichia phage fp01]QIE02405.1 hypothetical protein [Escherichia phage fp01]